MIRQTVRTSTRYVVNGVEYRSLEEMPQDVRRLFSDANHNGVPDAIEDQLREMGVDPATIATTETRTEQVVVTSSSLGEDPASRLLALGTEEAPPLPGEVRRGERPAVTITLDRQTLIWLALALLGVLVALWRLTR